MLKRVLACLPLACAGLAPAQQHCDGSQAPLSLPAVHFEDHGDGTLTDRRSRLMWMRCSLGQRWEGGACRGEAARLDWPAAQEAARALNSGGSLFFNDWRLPQLRELAQVTERRCENPRTNLALFPGTPAELYWTATPRAGDSSSERAFALSFGAHGVQLEDKRERFHVRLVRTGP
jgi:Protein of unknown function (DUF1566)